jgi:hypothetical protein
MRAVKARMPEQLNVHSDSKLAELNRVREVSQQ